MKRTTIFAISLMLVAALAGCNKFTSSASSTPALPASAGAPDAVAATVGEITITNADLDEAAKTQLQRVQTEIFKIRKGTLNGLVEEKLIEFAAKKKGQSPEAFVAAEVSVQEPSDQEVQALYDARKGRINKPFAEVKGQLKEYLMRNREARARADLIARLKKETPVSIKLEAPRVKIDTAGAPGTGTENAKIQLVEFSDYQCPFCKRVRQTIWDLMDQYKGNIEYIFMDFPLSFHKEAKKAHEAARCAGDQDKYYEFNRKLFENQRAISVAELKNYAKELKLDTKKFDACLDSGEKAKIVEDFTARGASAGVSGTPAFFINGIMISGAQPKEAFTVIIDEELKK